MTGRVEAQLVVPFTDAPGCNFTLLGAASRKATLGVVGITVRARTAEPPEDVDPTAGFPDAPYSSVDREIREIVNQLEKYGEVPRG
jgi:hypothetical protein